MQFSKLYTSCIALLAICGLSTVAHADFTNVTNTFVVSSSTTDPNETNNTATDEDQPNFVDLSVTKTITEQPAGNLRPGDATGTPANNVIKYLVELKNQGNVQAVEVDFTDTFGDTGLTGNWTCSESNDDGGVDGCGSASGSGDINWSDIRIEVGETVSIVLTVTVDETYLAPTSKPSLCEVGELQNIARITAFDGEFNVGDGNVNNVAPFQYSANDATADDYVDHACKPVDDQADLVAMKDDGLNYYTPGGQSDYTIVAWNLGPARALGVTFTDTLPDGATYDSSVCTKYTNEVAPGETPVTETLTATHNAGVVTLNAGTIIAHQSTGTNDWDGTGMPNFTNDFPDEYVECVITVNWSIDPNDY